jgi:L-histidine N-alpha-methyltransferase
MFVNMCHFRTLESLAAMSYREGDISRPGSQRRGERQVGARRRGEAVREISDSSGPAETWSAGWTSRVNQIADAPDAFFENARHHSLVLGGLVCGRLPLKFAYAGAGAHLHAAYAASSDYRQLMAAAHDADAVLRARLTGHLAGGLVDIGPGTGTRTSRLLTRLDELGHPCHRYLGVDFSTEMLHLSRCRLAADGTRAACTSHVWDVEESATAQVGRWRLAAPLLACLLGNTLGNLEQPRAALDNIRRSLRPGDALLATVLAVPSPGEDPLAGYRSAVFRRSVLAPLHAVGVRDADLVLRLEDDSVVGEAVIPGPVQLPGLRLPAGHRIRCFRSRRFSAATVRAAFESSGWSVHSVVPDPTGAQLAVVAMVVGDSNGC